MTSVRLRSRAERRATRAKPTNPTNQPHNKYKFKFKLAVYSLSY